MNETIAKLAQSDEPCIRYRTMVHLCEKSPKSSAVRKAQRDIRSSERVNLLLSERDGEGRIPYHPYAKWYGAHWVLAALADIDYPPGDKSLVSLREQVFEWLLSERHEKSIKCVEGRVRRCASQESNALYSMLKLGLNDHRCDELAARLVKWQWPDGGWNCDKRPEAAKSSFMESLTPLRALALYTKVTDDQQSRRTVKRAAQIFLKRKLYKRACDGSTIADDFVRLHYPCYWHYDILFGLNVMAEAGFVEDKRCRAALDLLESKRLPDGGWPAEKKYYRVTDKRTSNRSLADWGGANKRRVNEFVTVDALYVLKAAGRRLH